MNTKTKQRTMRIEELSIGDWVNYEGKTVKIKGVCSMVTFEISEHLLCTSGACNIEPIPLTPEILEKNGFVYPCKKNDDYCATLFCSPIPSKNHHIGDFAETWIHKECCEIKIFTSAKPERLYPQYDYDFMLEHYGFKYVHQLQHLLRLMGIEKEIEV